MTPLEGVMSQDEARQIRDPQIDVLIGLLYILFNMYISRIKTLQYEEYLNAQAQDLKNEKLRLQYICHTK